jgi:dTDP-4-dehydrorhamnose reductase
VEPVNKFNQSGEPIKILLTGAGGLLGSTMLSLFKDTFEIVGYTRHDLDVVDYKEVQNKISFENPDIIIHVAANTNAEECEGNKNLAYNVNTIGTQNIVNAVLGSNKNTVLVYLSSTGIYGAGKTSPYTEYDPVIPTTVHHKSKLEGEKAVQVLNKYLIIRTGWLFGGGVNHKKCFVYKRYLEARNKDYIYSDNSQRGNPTYVDNLAAQIQFMLAAGVFGIFNCVDLGAVSRYEYVKKIIELFGLDCTVKKGSKEMFKRIAPVSFNESAINYKLDLMGINLMTPWEKSLKKYIDQIKLKF